MRKTAHRNAALLLAFGLTAVPPLGAQVATRVKDLIVDPPSSGSPMPYDLWAVGDKVFFNARTPDAGRELWVTDGSQNGTFLLRDICPGDCSTSPLPLLALRDVLLFTDSSGGYRLWRTDGTRAGTYMLSPSPGLFSGDAPGVDHAVAGSRLFYAGCDRTACGLWATDGTREGTRRVDGGRPPIWLATVGDRVVFTRQGSAGSEVWVSDGSAAGTVLVKSFGSGQLRGPAAAGGHLFFSLTTPADGEEMWASDGTSGGTRAVTHFAPAAPFDGSLGSLIAPTAAGRHLYFLADDGVHGRELWRSDGTPQGTLRISDFASPSAFPGSNRPAVAESGDRAVFRAFDSAASPTLWSSQGSPQSMIRLADPCGEGCQFIELERLSVLTEAGGKIFFLGNDGVHGVEPWVTDGTRAGTHMVRDICTGPCDSSRTPVFISGGSSGRPVFFSAISTVAGTRQLWRTDGTAAGTRKLTAFHDGGTVIDAGSLAVSRNRVFFPAAQNFSGVELWVVEGDQAPRVAAHIDREEISSDPAAFTPLRDRVLFIAGAAGQRDIWKTDGTAAGTLRVTDTPFYSASSLTPAGEALLFHVGDGNGQSLWRTDGTTAGTTPLLLDLNAFDLTAFSGTACFFTLTPGAPNAPKELWRSDGTPGGTGPVVAVASGSGVFPKDLTAVDGALYFVVADPLAGTVLWHSDGTPSGTQPLAPLPGRRSGDVLRPVRAGSRVYFLNGGSLWETDGTAGGTAPRIDQSTGLDISDLAALDGVLYLVATGHGTSTPALWRSDGTAAGTVLVKELGATSSLVAAAGRLFFVTDDGAHGAELWTSDGTAAGTALVRDILPGTDSSGIDHLTLAGGRVFFTAFDGIHGTELWESDGTEAGTRMVQDIEPGAAPSSPAELAVIPAVPDGPGERLFFSAFDEAAGREPWVLPLSGPAGCLASSTALCLNGGRYRVEAVWRDFSGHTGTGQAVALSADTGYFWFFDAGNVETVVKILDGRGVNGHVWVFYGALSNVEYTLTVTDTQTGLTRQYYNAPGQLASVGDVYGFGPLGAYGANRQPPVTAAPPSRQSKAAAVPCVASAEKLCLNGGRFGVEVAWKDFQGHTGQGTAVPLSGDTGTFWFFNAANIELVVKALDGRPVNGHFWIFFGALSNVEYTVTVTDSQTGTKRTYTNPSGRFASVADTTAF
jgi:ELWxxDGT repeat protein